MKLEITMEQIGFVLGIVLAIVLIIDWYKN